jgi:hypothetical protein
MSTARYTASIVVIGLFVVWSLLLLVYGVPQPEPEGYKGLSGQWATALYNYQTFITGCMAVGAALGTIWKMGQIDEKQRERHEQLVRLSRRPDALKVERALYPTFGKLRVCYKQMRDYKFEWDNPDPDSLPDEFFADVALKIPEIKKTVKEIHGYLQPLCEGDTALLFGGHLTSDLKILLDAVVSLMGSIRSYEERERERQSWELADSRGRRTGLDLPISQGLANERSKSAIHRMELMQDIPMQTARIDRAFAPVFKGFWSLIDLYELTIEIA